MKQLKRAGPFPPWLHLNLSSRKFLCETKKLLSSYNLNTVCKEAKCPNLFECWSKKSAAFLILGRFCTRNCAFCDISFAKKPPLVDSQEGEKLATLIQKLQIKHAVLTMPSRDDLPDGGAQAIKKIVLTIRSKIPSITLELLTSDFGGNQKALDHVLSLCPEIFNHNLETVKRLTPKIRHKATYQRSLDVLKRAKERSSSPRLLKSGFMVGLGETEEEIIQTLNDLSKVGADIVTIGQYLQPSASKYPTKSFLTPEQFQKFEKIGKQLKIPYLFAGPFVRSSYNAEQIFSHLSDKKQND